MDESPFWGAAKRRGSYFNWLLNRHSCVTFLNPTCQRRRQGRREDESLTWPSGEKEGAKGGESLNTLFLCSFARWKGASHLIFPEWKQSGTPLHLSRRRHKALGNTVTRKRERMMDSWSPRHARNTKNTKIQTYHEENYTNLDVISKNTNYILSNWVLRNTKYTDLPLGGRC